jgi:hypothetical protein
MAEPSHFTRLWYQSFVHPKEQLPYIERLQGLLDASASAGIQFEVHGLDPPDHLFHPLTEFRCAAQTIRNRFSALALLGSGPLRGCRPLTVPKRTRLSAYL